MINRNLDEVYFRVEREGKWQNICFTDLTDSETMEVLKGRTEGWLTSLYDRLVEVLIEIKEIVNHETVDHSTKTVLELLSKKEMSVEKLINIKNIIRNFADFYDIIRED